MGGFDQAVDGTGAQTGHTCSSTGVLDSVLYGLVYNDISTHYFSFSMFEAIIMANFMRSWKQS